MVGIVLCRISVGINQQYRVVSLMKDLLCIVSNNFSRAGLFLLAKKKLNKVRTVKASAV